MSRSPEIKVCPSPPSRRALSRWRSMRTPAPPRAGGHSISRMEPLSFWIERDWTYDRRAPLGAQVVHADRLAHAQQTRFDEPERDRPAKGWAEIARCHVALRLPRTTRALRHMRAGRQRRFSRRHAQADQLLAARVDSDWHEERALADIFVRPRIARPRDPEVVRHGRPVGVLADDDVPLLRAQNHQRLEPHGPAVESRQPFRQTRAQTPGAACGNGEFVRPVAGEAHARNPEWRAIKCARRERHMRQALI